jgi:phosphatidylethanolamine-binding protein (PEBP) family uncharacterized protein
VHHYHFRLFALDVETLGVAASATRAQVDGALKAHVIGSAELIGTDERR